MERNTAQRRAICRAFEESGRPMSPQEVLKAAEPHASGLGIATVYRTLNSLAESGWLLAVQIPGEPPRYEMCGKAHHHHFRCRSCNQVYEIQGCPGNLEPLLPKGFRLEGHEVVLYGLCATCPKPADVKARRRRP